MHVWCAAPPEQLSNNPRIRVHCSYVAPSQKLSQTQILHIELPDQQTPSHGFHPISSRTVLPPTQALERPLLRQPSNVVAAQSCTL